MSSQAVMVSCPECRAGKHRNCPGQAWDVVLDELTTCACAVNGHRGETS